MIKLRAYLEKELRNTILSWDQKDIYAISFFLYANISNQYNGYANVTNFTVGFNTEGDCGNTDDLSEKRWNYAFWRHDGIPIIDADTPNEGIRILFEWYKEKGIDNIGYEDYTACYDERMRYIGKGPVGYYELLMEVATVAKEIQNSGLIEKKFGKKIPIIIHDLEYPWYVIEANKIANPNGEADTFLAAMKNLGIVGR